VAVGSASFRRLAAPAGTPKAVIDKLPVETAAALRDPEVKAQLNERGITVVEGKAADFAALMKADAERLGRVIKDWVRSWTEAHLV
jgi:tripartite-type tricarboxylate transporter receptor subunit TctC